MAGWLISVVLAGGVAASQPPDTVDGGVIEVGRGAARVSIGMPLTRVEAVLGRPVRVDSFGVLSYRLRGTGAFDVFPDCHGGTNQILIRSPRGSAWTLGNGIRVFRPDAVRRIFNAYGARLRRIDESESGLRAYRLTDGSGRHRVRTVFTVDRLDPKVARVVEVGIHTADFRYSQRCRPIARGR